MLGKQPPFSKVVAVYTESKKPYYLVRFYEGGRAVYKPVKLLKPEFMRFWFNYNQSLLEYGYVSLNERREGRTIRVVFSEAASRHYKLYVLYLRSIDGLKSGRRVDCLAKCWSRIDSTSPIIDVLWELSMIVEPKRFSNLLRGYCLCK